LNNNKKFFFNSNYRTNKNVTFDKILPERFDKIFQDDGGNARTRKGKILIKILDTCIIRDASVTEWKRASPHIFSIAKSNFRACEDYKTRTAWAW